MGQLEMYKINNTAPTLRSSQASRKQKQNEQYRCQYRGQCPGEDTPRCLSAGQGEVLSGQQERIKPGKLPGAADSERSPEGKQELSIQDRGEEAPERRKRVRKEQSCERTQDIKRQQAI